MCAYPRAEMQIQVSQSHLPYVNMFENCKTNGAGGGGTRWRRWLRNCATCAEGRGLDSFDSFIVIEIFHFLNTNHRTMVLG
jgi:hypothetical protein